MRRASRRSRLALRPLEGRVVPAFNLTIDGGPDFADTATVNVTVDTSTPGLTTFTPNASGAVLDVDAIETALNAGDVEINTGSGGAGNITWTFTSPQFQDDLDYSGSALRTLTFRTGGGSVTTNGVYLTFQHNLDLVIDTTGTGPVGNINLNNRSWINSAYRVALNAGAGTVTLNMSTVDALGPATIVAGAAVSTGPSTGYAAVHSDTGAVTVNANVAVTAAEMRLTADQGAVILNGPVDGSAPGTGELLLDGRTVAVNAPVGAIIPLNLLTLAGGDVAFGPNPITATTIAVAGANFGAGTGLVTGTVQVNSGALTPGGVGSVGTLNVFGDVVFNGGTLAPDVGPVSDLLNVTGTSNLTINSGTLGGPLATGQLPVGTPATQVIAYTGTGTGAFTNAPDTGAVFALGSDLAHVSDYGPPGVWVAPVAALPAGTPATGADPDGTAYTIKLTGGGELVHGKTASGIPAVAVRNSAPTSVLTVTTRANASDAAVDFDSILVNGPLLRFNGPRASVRDQFVVTGPARSVTLNNVFGPVTLGGTAADSTRFTARDVSGNLTAGSALSALTVHDLSGDVTAAAVGSAKVGGQVSGGTWAVTGPVGSLSAERISNLNLTARNLGSLRATGSPDRSVSGDITSSTFTLTDNDGTLGRYGLKTVTAAGTVSDTTFNVKAGNVNAVTVGRFVNSNLYLDYNPTAPFNTSGSFGATNSALNLFRTTARTIGDETNPLNWAFVGSQIAADTIGTVRLSGVDTDNGGTAFGIKFRTAATSVRVADAGPAALTNSDLTAGTTAGDFFFLKIV